MHCVELDNPTMPWVGRDVTSFSLCIRLFTSTIGWAENHVRRVSDLLLDQSLHLWAVKQDTLAQLLWWLAVADGAKVKNLCITKSQYEFRKRVALLS